MNTSIKILVVDDDVNFRDVVVMWFELSDFQKISSAENGAAAFERLLAEGDYDLVVTDLHMPQMDGLELTRRIRSLEAIKPPKVILTSGQSCENEARAVGANAFLQKPYALASLDAAVATLFP